MASESISTETKWKIKIKTLKADTFSMEISPTMTVDELKLKIKEIKKIEPTLQRLIFRGRILKSKNKLSDYEVSNGSTIHLVAKKPSNNNSQNSQNRNTQNTQNANNNNHSHSHPHSHSNSQPQQPRPNQNQNQNQNPFQHFQRQQAAHLNAIQHMIQNMNNAQRQNQHQNQHQHQNGSQPRPMPRINVIRRNINQNSQANTVRSMLDDGDDDEENKINTQQINVKPAEFNNDNDPSLNLIKWKIKKTKVQNWIKKGKKFGCYFSDCYELNNGSIWRFFVYPNGINQAGYHDDCVLFISLDELPFGVNSMEVEFAMHFKTGNVNFKFRKCFNNFVCSAGWPRNFLKLQKILDLPQNKNYVKFTCDLIIHCVCFNGKKMTNQEYILWKQNNPENILTAKGNDKPNGKLFRWGLKRKTFIDATFKQYQQSKVLTVNGFKWHIQIYPSGLTRSGFVQPYLHLLKMPYGISRVDARFSFYIREVNIGYSHVDTFNGKMGKGWPDARLKKDEFKWDQLKSITFDVRINILNVNLNNTLYFIGEFNKKNGVSAQQQQEEMKQNQPQQPSSRINSNLSESKDDKDEEESEEEESKNDVTSTSTSSSSSSSPASSDNVQKNDGVKGDEMEFKKWLNDEVGLVQYFDLFIENEIHSLDDILEYIEEKNHLGEIGIKPFAHKAKMWKNIVKLREMRDTVTIDNDEPSQF